MSKDIVPGIDNFHVGAKGLVTLPGVLRCVNGVWWREFHFTPVSLAPGASGATLVEPSANTPGGYNLDDDGEHLTFQVHIHDDWDGASDPVFEVSIENDMAAQAIGTTAIMKIDTYSKGTGETAIKTQNLSDTVAVDDDARYTMYEAELALDYDAGGGVDVDANDIIGCHLWFDVTNSVNLTDVIISHVCFKYRTKQVLPEV